MKAESPADAALLARAAHASVLKLIDSGGLRTMQPEEVEKFVRTVIVHATETIEALAAMELEAMRLRARISKLEAGGPALDRLP